MPDRCCQDADSWQQDWDAPGALSVTWRPELCHALYGTHICTVMLTLVKGLFDGTTWGSVA